MKPQQQVGSLDRLIEAVYATVTDDVDDCGWCNLLPRMCKAFDAFAGGLVTQDFSAGAGQLRHGFNIGSHTHDAHGDDLSSPNPWLCGFSPYPEGSVFVAEETSPATAFRKSNGTSSPSPHRLCGVITRAGTEGYLIHLLRSPEVAPFSERDKDALARLMPHLRRSLKLHQGVMRDRGERASLVELLDHFPVAFFLVNQNGRLLLHNRAARDMLAHGDGLYLRAGYLTASLSTTTTQLRRLISRTALGQPDGGEPATDEHFILSTGVDRLPLICVLYAVGGLEPEDQRVANRTVAIAIKDPNIDSSDSITDFVSTYQLTTAEARLIDVMMKGYGLFDAARSIGISRNTARTHMRNIYSKVGTNRQADLIRLLHRFNVF